MRTEIRCEVGEWVTVGVELIDPVTRQKVDLSGVTVGAAGKRRFSDAAPVFTATGTLDSPSDGKVYGASVGFVAPAAGVYQVSVPLSKPGNGWPQIETFALEVKDHA